MEELDLTRDLPEEFEGKVVVIDDTRYRIGSLMGEGHESFVHGLVNSRSGIAFLVIKILRDQDALDHYTELMRTMGPAMGGLEGTIPYTRLLSLHGGIFLIQKNHSNQDRFPDETALRDAEASVKSQ